MRHRPVIAIGMLAVLLFTAGCSAAVEAPVAEGSVTTPTDTKVEATPSPTSNYIDHKDREAEPFSGKVTPSKSYIRAGETIRVTGTTFDPDSTLEVTIMSYIGPWTDKDGVAHPEQHIYVAGPIPTTADAEGRVDVNLTIPQGTPHSTGSLTISSPQGDGGIGSVKQGSGVSVTLADPQQAERWANK